MKRNDLGPDAVRQLEAAEFLPAVIELAQSRGWLTLTSMLRYLAVPYGVGARILESLEADHLVRFGVVGGAPRYIWTGGVK